MDCQLRLSVGQHELIWKRKSVIEARFKVQIDSPFSRGYTPFNWVYKGFNQNDILIIAAKGEVANVEAFEKYAAETVTNPEIIEIFSYHKDLRPIFEDIMWIEILEEIYGVYITTKTGCELNIAGTESSVSSAVSAMEELILKYKECQDTLTISNEKSLVPKLVYVLGVCRNVNILPGTFNRIPNDVITLLLSLLEKLYKENFPVYDDSLSLDDSVLVLDAPEKEAESSVIILDSDSDDSNVKHCFGNGSENVSKRKKKQPIPNKTGRKLKKLRKKGKCKPEGGSSQNTVSHQNGNLQLQQVGTSIDVCKLPVIENPNFIPLNFGKSTQQKCQLGKLIDSNTEVSAEQVNQPVAEEVQPAEVPKPPKQLRPVVIDGCNVAFYSTKGRREDFSWKRIEKSIKYFQDRGHANIKVFIPQHRRALCYAAAGNQKFVEMLETEQLLVFTPSRKVDGTLISCYDDRFIVDLAARNGGVILSNDNYRDLMGENVNWAETIKKRLLMYVFAGDELMIPNDPLGARGPNLDDFLAFPEGSSDGQN